MVRRLLALGEPVHLDVAPALQFQPPGGTHPVEVAVEVYLEQHGGLVRGGAEAAGLGLEAQFAQVEAVDEGIYDPNHVVLGDQVFEGDSEKAVLEAEPVPYFSRELAGLARHRQQWRGCLAATSKIARFSIRAMDGQTFFTI